MPDADEDKDQDDGVQRLIDRIRGEAVSAGRSEAEEILARARAEAAALLEAAAREREELQKKAHREIAIEKQAARAAVHTAARDVILSLKAGVVATFEAHVERLVTDTLRDPALLRTLVLVIAGRVAQEVLVDKELEVVVSALLDEAPSAKLPTEVRDGILGICERGSSYARRRRSRRGPRCGSWARRWRWTSPKTRSRR